MQALTGPGQPHQTHMLLLNRHHKDGDSRLNMQTRRHKAMQAGDSKALQLTRDGTMVELSLKPRTKAGNAGIERARAWARMFPCCIIGHGMSLYVTRMRCYKNGPASPKDKTFVASAR